METGDIEVIPTAIRVTGKAKNVLPFEINIGQDVREDLRLEYRFLDLRNNKLHNTILLRSQIMKTLRNKMDELGFTEIQTPILANSSPEGARDFLVPSRLHPGEFYALPQAPQQFKQLLMVSGFNKYFQVENDVLVSDLIEKLSFIPEVWNKLRVLCEKNINQFKYYSSFEKFKISKDSLL